LNGPNRMAAASVSTRRSRPAERPSTPIPSRTFFAEVQRWSGSPRWKQLLYLINGDVGFPRSGFGPVPCAPGIGCRGIILPWPWPAESPRNRQFKGGQEFSRLGSCHLKPVDLNAVTLTLDSVTGDKRLQAAFGRAVRKSRNGSGLSQEKLAALAGLNRTYVGDVERGERNISIVNMQKIAKALGVRLSTLVTETERYLRGRAR
jgi:DNA-binding XRE family transcriptional regulator